MNIRKPVDYSAIFTALDKLVAAELPQMKVYSEIGRLVSGRQEKGAAVAAAEYLNHTYPDVPGFSPRNLRRMRDFYHTYENTPEVLAQALNIGWTQNVVILESELTIQERAWYIRTVRRFGWSKAELTMKIQERVHETIALDSTADTCYSNVSEGDENGEKESSGTLLQGLRNAEIQRELQRQASCGAYLQSLLPSLTGAAGGTDDTPPSAEPTTPPPERERDDLAEKSNPRSPARGEVPGLHGLCGAFPPLGEKPEKTGSVHSNAGFEHRRRSLRCLWRPGVCQGEIPTQPKPRRLLFAHSRMGHPRQ